MKRVLVVGEDALTCALGEQIVAQLLPEWGLAQQTINTKGVTKLVPALPRYIEQARYVQPVLCIADTDGKCVKTLLNEWLSQIAPETFLLRLAVTEAESWLIADRRGLANFLDISEARIPEHPDALPDPKRKLLTLAKRSKKSIIRRELVSQLDPSKPGSGYNAHLCDFVKNHWQSGNAAPRSPSLARALARVAMLKIT